MATTTPLFANAFSTTLSSSVASGATTSFSLASVTGLPTIGTDQYVPCVVVDTSTTPETVKEYVNITSVSGTTATVVRAAEDSARFPAAALASGLVVAAVVTKSGLLKYRPRYGTAAAKPAATVLDDGEIYVETDTNGGAAFQVQSGAWVQLAPGVTAANGYQIDYKNNTSATGQTVASGSTIDITSLTGLSVPDTARPVYFTAKLQIRMSANSAGASGSCAVNVGIVETTGGGFTKSYPVPCPYLASGLGSSNGAVIAGADSVIPVVVRYGASLSGGPRTFKVTATGAGTSFTYTIRNSDSEFWAEAK